MKKICSFFFILLVLVLSACGNSPQTISENQDTINVLYKKPNPNKKKQQEHDERVARQKQEHIDKINSTTYKDHLLTIGTLNNSTLYLPGVQHFSYIDEFDNKEKYLLRIDYTFTNKSETDFIPQYEFGRYFFLTQEKLDVKIGDSFDFSFSNELRGKEMRDATNLFMSEIPAQYETLEKDQKIDGFSFYKNEDPSKTIYVYIYQPGYPDLDILLGVETIEFKKPTLIQ